MKQEIRPCVYLNPFIYGGVKDYLFLFKVSSEKLTQISLELHLKSMKQNKLTKEKVTQLVYEYQKIESSRLQKGSTIQKIASMLAQ